MIIQSKLEALSKSSSKWKNDTPIDERIEIAKQIRSTLDEDQWFVPTSSSSSSDDNGINLLKDLELLRIHHHHHDQNVKTKYDSDYDIAFGSLEYVKFSMSDTVHKFLMTYIDSQMRMKKNDETNKWMDDTKKRVDCSGKHEVYGKFEMDFTAPKQQFEVWCSFDDNNDNNDDDDDTKKKKKTNSNPPKNNNNNNNNNNNTVGVVLAAGNQPFLTMIDVLQMIFIHRKTVLLKHHPLRPFLLGPLQVIFQPLIQHGLFDQILHTNIEDATYLVTHPLVDHIQITGSRQSVDVIEHALEKVGKKDMTTITAELGGASPCIVVPGVFSKEELRHMARLIVSNKKLIGGCGCLCTQVLILSKEWSQKEEFMKCLKDEFRRIPTYPCFYPQSRSRRRLVRERYVKLGKDRVMDCPADHRVQPNHDGPAPPSKEALEFFVNHAKDDGNDEDDQPVIVFCGTPGEEGYDGYAVENEMFGPVLAIVDMKMDDKDDVKDYLSKTVVPYVNKKVFGSLVCILLAPESIISTNNNNNNMIEQTISNLEYGGIAVNTSTVFCYATSFWGGTWGAHPIDSANKAESGMGVIGNIYGLNHPIKSVVYGESLNKPPAFDLGVAAPGIVMDCMYEMDRDSSLLMKICRIWLLLFVRSLQYVLWKMVGMGGKPYNSAMP